MSVQLLDTVGLRCPQPVFKRAVKAIDVKSGNVLEVIGDCPTFERDLRSWCQRLGKLFLAVNDDGNRKKTIQIQF